MAWRNPVFQGGRGLTCCSGGGRSRKERQFATGEAPRSGSGDRSGRFVNRPYRGGRGIDGARGWMDICGWQGAPHLSLLPGGEEAGGHPAGARAPDGARPLSLSPRGGEAGRGGRFVNRPYMGGRGIDGARGWMGIDGWQGAPHLNLLPGGEEAGGCPRGARAPEGARPLSVFPRGGEGRPPRSTRLSACSRVTQRSPGGEEAGGRPRGARAPGGAHPLSVSPRGGEV